MKPSFALSLSFEGIRLLHRAAGGWRIVGDVTLDAADLNAELSTLRKTAADLEPAGVRCKLIIPNGQIKYLTIDTIGLSEEARRAAARAALEGATPYEVDDLVFDISNDGPKTHIAAVAVETLAEAESFAQEHRFHPVSFVAIPGDAPYLGEPFFGTTKCAATLLDDGESVAPDGIAVVIVGDIKPEEKPDTPVDVAQGDPVLVDPVQESEDSVAAPESDENAEVETIPMRPTLEALTLPSGGKPEPEQKSAAAAETVDETVDDVAEDAPELPDAPAQPAAPAFATNTKNAAKQPQTPDTQPAAPAVITPATDAAKTPGPSAKTPDAPAQPAAPSFATSTKDTAKKPEPLKVLDAPEKAGPPEPLVPDLLDPVKTPASVASPKPFLPTPTAPTPAAPTPAAAAPMGLSITGDGKPGDAPAFKAPPADAANPIVGPPAPATPSAGFATRRSDAPPAPKTPVVAQRPVAAGIAPSSIGPASPATTGTTPISAGTTDNALKPVAHAPNLPKPAPLAPDSSSFKTPPSPTETTPPPKAKTGFLSRRKPGKEPAKPEVVTGPKVETPNSEAERMTVFGARKKLTIGGKPRFLGLIMTVILLVFLAGVAAWASVFMDNGLARLFGDREGRATASAPATEGIDIPQTPDAPTGVQTASLDPDLTDEDGAVLDAMRNPVAPEIHELTQEEAEAKYAATGIWPLAPDVPSPPATISLDDFYITSIDPVSTSTDAVALPAALTQNTDIAFGQQAAPAAAGSRFVLDARGLVTPTAQGTPNPDGIVVYLGRPPATPPVTLARLPVEPELETATDALAESRPRLRPNTLAETTERAQLDGLTRVELAGYRPKFRPKSVQEAAQEAAAATAASLATAAAQAAAAQEVVEQPVPKVDPAYDSPTRFAAAQSRRPDTRPRNFARIVQRAEKRSAQQEQAVATQTASVAAVAPRSVQPSNPSKTSVAKQATTSNAINLRKVNLIGVYGKPSRRRALVRLANGRYQKVVVGDRLDGGQISAIGDSELRYTKRGRSVILKMPNT